MPPPALRFSGSDQRLAALYEELKSATDIAVLMHVFGLKSIANLTEIAKAIAQFIILVVIDTEHWSPNTDQMTEVGTAVISMQDLRPITEHENPDYGDHGENLMKLVRYNLLRIVETAHLPRTDPNSKGVEGNRYGYWRFATSAQVQTCLTKIFVQRIDGVEGVSGGHCPVVILGHDVGHDVNHLKEKSIKLDIEGLGTIVRLIDTQQLAREVFCWQNKDQIGLAALTKKLHFEHSDAHTATNDAARTMIAAIQLGILHHPCKTRLVSKTMQEVADGLEVHSLNSFKPIGGSHVYCWRCGSYDHMKRNCPKSGQELHCAYCEQAGRLLTMEERHITLHCIHDAYEKARVRREKYALAKAGKKSQSGARHHNHSALSSHVPPTFGLTPASYLGRRSTMGPQNQGLPAVGLSSYPEYQHLPFIGYYQPQRQFPPAPGPSPYYQNPGFPGFYQPEIPQESPQNYGTGYNPMQMQNYGYGTLFTQPSPNMQPVYNGGGYPANQPGVYPTTPVTFQADYNVNSSS